MRKYLVRGLIFVALLVRVSDGAILAKNLGSTGPNSPLVQDGKVFFVAGQVRGYTLPKTFSAQVSRVTRRS